MKTYDEVVARVANTMFNSHMGGGSKYSSVSNQFGLIAFIFGVTEHQVRNDADTVFRNLNNGFD